MPRHKTKLHTNLLRKENQLAEIEQTETKNVLGEIFTKSSDFGLIRKSLKLTIDCAHLGMEFIEKSIRKTNIFSADNEQAIAKEISHLALDYVKNIEQILQFSNEWILLVPPVSKCFSGHKLTAARAKFRNVTIYTGNGQRSCWAAYIYCHHCQESYNCWSVDQNNRKRKHPEDESDCGLRSYYTWDSINFVAANEKHYFHKDLCEHYATQLVHNWTSYQGFAESYNESQRNIAQYVAVNQGTSQDYSETHMDRRLLSAAFIEYEIWMHVGKMSRILDTDKFLKTADFNQYGSYQHVETKKCKEYACHNMAISDGCWKLQYRLCMFQRVKQGPLELNYPTNCPNQPVFNKAFCREHCDVMEKKGWPTTTRAFLSKLKSGQFQQLIRKKKFPGNREGQHQEANPVKQSRNVEKYIVDICEDNEEQQVSDDDSDHDDDIGAALPGSHYTGPITRNREETMKAFADLQANLVKEASEKAPDDNSIDSKLMEQLDIDKKRGEAFCTKNTGKSNRICVWSRGHFFIVAPCGHIHHWEPLYRSESPSQAFLIMLRHLTHVLTDRDPAEWGQYTMVYDNICHVDDMYVAREPLPLATPSGESIFKKPMNEVWLKINKAIDKLHISNHKNQKCHQIYHPDSITKLNPGIKENTMRAEQTFVWLSRFKKILCAMPKDHHHFILHRLVTRRNEYTFKKNSADKEVILPKVRSVYSS